LSGLPLDYRLLYTLQQRGSLGQLIRILSLDGPLAMPLTLAPEGGGYLSRCLDVRVTLRPLLSLVAELH
jgi:hypothetical protein